MKSFIPDIYMKRKLGSGKGVKYVVSYLVPALLLVLVSLLLVFSLTFITSMTDALDLIMRHVGSGDIRVDGFYESGRNDETAHVYKEATALAMSEDSSTAFTLKAVDFDSYFTPERERLLRIEYGERANMNSIVISESTAEELGVTLGDRFSLLVYEEEKNRTRPLLVTVSALYSTGYREFDEATVYIDNMGISGREYTELILDDPSSIDSRLEELDMEGHRGFSYRRLYSSMYSNVEFSSAVLYVIFALLAILAAFFSQNIAYEYTERDKVDIGTLRMMGLEGRAIRKMYFLLTSFTVLVSLLLGLVLGLGLSALIPDILSALESSNLAALGSYLVSFEVVIPVLPIALMLLLLFGVSLMSLYISLRHLESAEVLDILKC